MTRYILTLRSGGWRRNLLFLGPADQQDWFDQVTAPARAACGQPAANMESIAARATRDLELGGFVSAANAAGRTEFSGPS